MSQLAAKIAALEKEIREDERQKLQLQQRTAKKASRENGSYTHYLIATNNRKF